MEYINPVTIGGIYKTTSMDRYCLITGYDNDRSVYLLSFFYKGGYTTLDGGVGDIRGDGVHRYDNEEGKTGKHSRWFTVDFSKNYCKETTAITGTVTTAKTNSGNIWNV